MIRAGKAAPAIVAALALVTAAVTAVEGANAGAVTGVVVDDRNEPLELVRVRLASADGAGSWETLTDREGVFRFEALANGPYRLALSKPSYTTLQVPEFELEGGERSFDVAMFPGFDWQSARPKPDPDEPTGIYTAGDVAELEAFFPLDLHEERYLQHLEAMGEPSLFQRSRSGSAESYRLLWLRSFDRPVAVRVELQPVVPPTVTVKVLDGLGGYEPGKLAVSTERALSQTEVDALRRALVEHEFWDVPRSRPSEFVDRHGREVSIVCSDGASWVVEAAVRGRYRMIDWHCPSAQDAPRLLGEGLLGLTGLQFEEVY